MIAHLFSRITLFGFLILCAGCGGDGRFGASGTVKYKGTAIKTGLISFIPEGGVAPAGGAPIQEGKYEIPQAVGLVAGQYKVSISSAQSKSPVKVEEGPGESSAIRELIPEKYNGKTTLKAEVKSGSKNVFDFDLN